MQLGVMLNLHIVSAGAALSDHRTTHLCQSPFCTCRVLQYCSTYDKDLYLYTADQARPRYWVSTALKLSISSSVFPLIGDNRFTPSFCTIIHVYSSERALLHHFL